MNIFWKSNKIEDESVMLIAENGSTPMGNLIFAPIKVNKVVTYSSGREKFWREGLDYVIRGHSIIALNKDMPYMTDKEITGEDRMDGFDYSKIPSVTPGLFLPFTEGPNLLYKQIYVSYEHQDIWNYEVVNYAGDKLKRTLTKLKNKEGLNLFIYGDSISTGANSTGYLNVYPYKASWPNRVVDSLQRYYSGNINLINKSVGGWTSQDAIRDLESNGWVTDYNPDLVILGFGMNDATHGIDKITYKHCLYNIISNIRQYNSQCEFILIGTMLANPMAKNQSKNQISYYQVLEEIADNEEGIISVNIGKMHQMILNKGKKYIDMTSNNVNHPNDFMAGIYAMNILSLLLEND